MCIAGYCLNFSFKQLPFRPLLLFNGHSQYNVELTMSVLFQTGRLSVCSSINNGLQLLGKHVLYSIDIL